MAGLLSVFAEFEREILHERVMAGLAQARSNSIQLGRPRTALRFQKQIRELSLEGLSKAAIARQLKVGRTSVRRILAAEKEVAAAAKSRKFNH